LGSLTQSKTFSLEWPELGYKIAE